MNYIRQIVSGQRRRMVDGQYNLDLTYITPRIIAMSWPAQTAMETIYRNNYAEVLRYLE